MLPSKGFFKKNDCPFFEKGLCVRPHCHFRHRKKFLNDPSPSREADDAEEDVEADNAVIKLIEKVPDSDKKPCSSTSEDNSKESNSTHDTLFAKLVNQGNTYEKINRHIPCAYTPTPQCKKVEAKNKTVSGIAGFGNSEKSLELITKARTLLKNYCAENIKQCETKTAKGSDKKSDGCEQQSVSTENSASITNGCKYDENTTETKDNESDFTSQYKDVTAEAECNSESSEVKLSAECMSDKQDLRDGQMVLKTSNLKGHSVYVPIHLAKNVEAVSEKSSNVSVNMPDEKCGDLSLLKDGNDELSELDFVNSEIEIMKKILNDEQLSDEAKIGEKDNQISEEKDNKNKVKAEETYSSLHHYSSRHKSSKSRSSSSSKHSRSHSSRHSRSSDSSSRHRSSSRHHSSSSSRKSSDHHSSSRHSRAHHKKRHSEKYEAESEREKSVSHRDSSDKRKYSVSQSKTSSSSEEDEEDEEEADDCGMEVDTSLVLDEDSVDECYESSLRKRKKTEEEDEQDSKYISLCNYEDMDDDPDTIEQECLEIFNSYSSNSESQTKNAQEITLPNANYESAVQGKKRTAHSTAMLSDHSALRHKTVRKTNSIRSAQELMFERYKIAEKAREAQQQVLQNSPAPVVGLNRPSVRIAAVSNIQQLLLAKKAIQEKINQGLKTSERTTIAHSVAPGSSRVAHIPRDCDLTEKPTIREGSKQVPRVKRQTYLDKLLIETSKIYPTKNESVEEALKMEREIFTLHSGSAAAYHAAFVSLLMKTRRRVAAVKGEKIANTISIKPKVSHFDVLSRGKKNFSVIKTKKIDMSMLSDKQIYEELLRFKLTPEELKKNGFPMSSDRPGYAVCSLNYDLKYNEKYIYIKKISGNRRYCIRCSKLYDVDPYTLKQYKEGPETCSYHPGRKRSGGRNCERVYNCCNTSSTEGCATHVRHVTDSNDYENYPNCVRTLAKNDMTDPGVYALDCEMVYSRLGTELARVTVVNLKKEIVYDTLVKPKYPVDCYNTFYSGIEEKMMEGVETTLKDVQAVLLSMFSDKTILIGHSLDSDLRALHLIHDTVVDTSILFKNEKYFPIKYSLKELCARKISKIIQDNVNGHDSSEDAIAALEIMLHHVKEEVAKYDSLESYEADRGR